MGSLMVFPDHHTAAGAQAPLPFSREEIMMRSVVTGLIGSLAAVAILTSAQAAEFATKDEAQAMVKK